MIKFLIKLLENSLGFSKVESVGTMVLMIVILSTAVFTNTFIRLRKSDEPGIESEYHLKKWIAQVDSSYEIKLLENQKVKGNSTSKTKWTRNTKKEKLKAPFAKKPTKPAKTNATPPKIVKKDINLANAEDLQQVKGIGLVFSNRIIKFRDALGGYYDIYQLSEVYGLDSVTVAKVRKYFEVFSEPEKIPINSDSIKALIKHPYIDYTLAKLMIAYRKANGNFRSANELKKMKTVNDSLFLKLKPYLE